MSRRYPDPLMRILLGSPRLPGEKSKYALYKLYDAGDVLLYVGISLNVQQRFKQHAKAQPWWPEVADKEVSYFLSTAAEARRRERHKITLLRPKYNKQHNSARRLDPGWPSAPRYGRARREASRGGGDA